MGGSWKILVSNCTYYVPYTYGIFCQFFADFRAKKYYDSTPSGEAAPRGDTTRSALARITTTSR